eukprot:3595929-Prymnesium_polylepis.2
MRGADGQTGTDSHEVPTVHPSGGSVGTVPPVLRAGGRVGTVPPVLRAGRLVGSSVALRFTSRWMPRTQRPLRG